MEVHVSQKKKRTVAKLQTILKDYSVIGVANLYGVPASQLQQIREKLRGKMEMLMAKKSLMKLALKNIESEKKGISKLADYFEGMPSLVLTNETPFKLSKHLAKNKTKAPAKQGQIAVNNIVVEAGPTPFSPGPVIGELGALGIKSGVENGKIVIKADKVLVKEGEEISPAAASILNRLGVKPMEIGIHLNVAYEAGEFYSKEVLSVDELYYIDQLRLANSEALGLSIELGIVTQDNINILLQKANAEAFALAKEQGIINKETIGIILQKANASSAALKNKIPEE